MAAKRAADTGASEGEAPGREGPGPVWPQSPAAGPCPKRTRREGPQGGGGLNGVLFGLGVLHGRLTVPCSTGAGLDESYPYEGGSIGKERSRWQPCVGSAVHLLQIGDLLGYGMLIFQNPPLWCCVFAYSPHQLFIIMYDTNQSPI